MIFLFNILYFLIFCIFLFLYKYWYFLLFPPLLDGLSLVSCDAIFLTRVMIVRQPIQPLNPGYFHVIISFHRLSLGPEGGIQGQIRSDNGSDSEIPLRLPSSVERVSPFIIIEAYRTGREGGKWWERKSVDRDNIRISESLLVLLLTARSTIIPFGTNILSSMDLLILMSFR